MVKRLAPLIYAFRRHGPLGLVRLVPLNMTHHISRVARCAHRRPDVDTFDREYGTDTSGTCNVASLDYIDSPLAQYAVQYEPSSANLVRGVLASLKIDAARFTFLDFGSGKGRVLLIAAGSPFKSVIGVELSKQLHAIALENIGLLPSELRRGARVCSINDAAASIDLPESDLVCYLNNPFGPPIVTRIVDRLTGHFRDRGYRVIVVYVVLRHRDIFEKSGIFTIFHETPDLAILTTMPRDTT